MWPYDVRDTDKAGLDYNTYYIVRIIIIIIITIWSHVGLTVVPMHTRQLTDMVIRLPTAKRDDGRPTQYLPKRILKTFQYDVTLCYSSRRCFQMFAKLSIYFALASVSRNNVMIIIVLLLARSDRSSNIHATFRRPSASETISRRILETPGRVSFD